MNRVVDGEFRYMSETDGQDAVHGESAAELSSTLEASPTQTSPPMHGHASLLAASITNEPWATILEEGGEHEEHEGQEEPIRLSPAAAAREESLITPDARVRDLSPPDPGAPRPLKRLKRRCFEKVTLPDGSTGYVESELPPLDIIDGPQQVVTQFSADNEPVDNIDFIDDVTDI